MDNNEPNKPKIINRIVTPISVNAPVEQKEVKEEVIKEVKKVKEHDSTTMIFVVFLLIVLAILTAFIVFYILPRFLDVKSGKYDYNDKEIPALIEEDDAFTLKKQTLTEDEFVRSDANYNIEGFNIVIQNNGNVLNLYINNILVTTCNALYNSVATIDDIILIGIKNNQTRTSKVLAIDTKGEVIKEFYNFGTSEGFVLLDQGNALIFNNHSFVVMTSRINRTTLILSNEFGMNEGINVCNANELASLNLEDNLLVLANFSIKYEGNHKFSDPYKVSGTKLNEYISINNYCK